LNQSLLEKICKGWYEACIVNLDNDAKIKNNHSEISKHFKVTMIHVNAFKRQSFDCSKSNALQRKETLMTTV